MSKYPDEVKVKVLKLFYEEGRSRSSLDKEFGLSRGTTGYWIKKDCKECIIKKKKSRRISEFWNVNPFQSNFLSNFTPKIHRVLGNLNCYGDAWYYTNLRNQIVPYLTPVGSISLPILIQWISLHTLGGANWKKGVQTRICYIIPHITLNVTTISQKYPLLKA